MLGQSPFSDAARYYAQRIALLTGNNENLHSAIVDIYVTAARNVEKSHLEMQGNTDIALVISSEDFADVLSGRFQSLRLGRLEGICEKNGLALPQVLSAISEEIHINLSTIYSEIELREEITKQSERELKNELNRLRKELSTLEDTRNQDIKIAVHERETEVRNLALRNSVSYETENAYLREENEAFKNSFVPLGIADLCTAILASIGSSLIVSQMQVPFMWSLPLIIGLNLIGVSIFVFIFTRVILNIKRKSLDRNSTERISNNGS